MNSGAPTIAYPVDQPLVAGKKAVGMSYFRASSQDGQYQPFAPGTQTLKLDSLSSLGENPVAAPFQSPEKDKAASPLRLRDSNPALTPRDRSSAEVAKGKSPETARVKVWQDLPTVAAVQLTP